MTPSFVAPGGTVTGTGKCNQPASFPGDTAGTGAIGALVGIARGQSVVAMTWAPLGGTDGSSWSASLVVPEGTSPGTYRMAASCLRANGTSSGDYDGEVPPNLQVTGATTPTVTVTSSQNPSTSVDGPTVTVTITGSAGPASGQVDVHRSGSTADTYVLLDGNGTATVHPGPGDASHDPVTYTFVYHGDDTYAPATPAPFTQLYGKAATTTTITGVPATLQAGQTIAVSGTVAFDSPPTSGVVPTGTVRIDDSLGSTLATVDVAGSGSSGQYATSVRVGAVGQHDLTATYVPDNPYTQTSSASASTVASPSVAMTITANGTTPASFTAHLTSIAPTTGTPTGSLVFTVDGSWVGTPIAVSGGTATSVAVPMSPGMHLIGARYFGHGQWSSAVATLIVTA